MTDSDQLHDQRLREILRNVAAEIARLSAVIAPVETALENGSTYGVGAERVVLQNLDLVMQTVDNLAVFLNRISDQISPEIRVDVRPALARIHLEATRHRLAAGSVDEGYHQDASESGYSESAVRSGRPELF